MLIALCGFDGSLNTTRGVRGTFTRASSANNPVTLAAEGNNVPSYVPGYWGNPKGALAIWEGTTNLVYNSGFETVTTTTTAFSDPITSSAAWTVQSGSFTYSSSGATTSGPSGVANIITAGNPSWTPLLGSDGQTSLPLKAASLITTPASLGVFIDLYLYHSTNDWYYLEWNTGNGNLYIARNLNGTETIISSVVAISATASTQYIMNLSIDHLGNLSGELLNGAGSSTLGSVSVQDTSFTGSFLLGVGGGDGVVTTNASMSAPFANGWVTGSDATPNGAYALTTDAAVGKYAMSVVTESTSSVYPIAANITVSASTVYTFTAYAKIVSGSPTTALRVIEETSAGALVLDSGFRATVTSTGGVYERLTYTWTTQPTTAVVQLRLQVDGAGTVEFDAVQLEQKGYSSPYLENDSTTATATRATESYTLSTTQASTASGAVRLRVRCDNTAFGTASFTGRTITDTSYGFTIVATGTNISFSAGAATLVAYSLAGYTSGEWLDVALVWNGSNFYGYLNGVQVASGVQGSGRLGALWYVGCEPDGNYEWDGPIDDLCIFSSALTPAQVYSLYSATVPLSDTYATPVTPDTDIYNSASSSPDANDVYTVVTYTRRDGTTYLVSTLSGTVAPAGSSNYPTLTWQYYDLTGTVVVRTQTFALDYDSNSKLISQTMTD